MQLPNEHELPAEMAAKWRADAIRSAERPEEFWKLQQVRILVRVQNRHVRNPRSLWLTAVTAALIFLSVLVITLSGPRLPKAPPQARVDADQELLLSVEHALATGTPEALEPLTLLVESSSNHPEAAPISHKEHGHEN